MLIKRNITITNLTTLGLVAIANEYCYLNNINQLAEIAAYINYPTKKFFVLGGGSNIIVPEYYNGLVIHNQLNGITVINRYNEELVLIKAAAGVSWDYFVSYTLAHGYFGLENLSYIPGTVGACPIQNIGAYGVQVADFVKSVEVFDLRDRQIKQLSRQDCCFGYRDSIFKRMSHYIITAVYFKLPLKQQPVVDYPDVAKAIKARFDATYAKNKAATPTISATDVREIVINIRKNKLPNPKILRNAGSFFHNPIVPLTTGKLLAQNYQDMPSYAVNNTHVKLAGGWLIDNLKLKGYKRGNLAIYDKQALIVVNHGTNTTQTELLAFASAIQDKVNTHYGITLTIEPTIID